MWSELKKLLNDVLTTAGGDYDVVKVAAFVPMFFAGWAFIGLSIYDTVINKKFDYNGFATGLAGVGGSIAAAAAGLRLKKGTEPGDEGAPPVGSTNAS